MGEKEKLTSAQVTAALMDEALRVVVGADAWPVEQAAAKPKAKEKPPVQQAAAEVLAKAKSALAVSEAELEASAARGKAVIDGAMRHVTTGRDRARLDREAIENYYGTKFGAEQESETEESAEKAAGKDFAEFVKGLSDEERDALMTAVYEADAAEDEYVQALRGGDETEEADDDEWTAQDEADAVRGLRPWPVAEDEDEAEAAEDYESEEEA
jgi:hypothetical protein